MTTLAKMVVSGMLTLLFLSCNLTPGITGDGNVKTEQRPVTQSFHSIHCSNGLDVLITQDATEGIKVQADENLHDYIITEVENEVLKIYTTSNIKMASKKQISVSFNNLKAIKGTSGCDITSTNTLILDTLDIEASSGGDINLSLEANHVSCSATSGSDVKLSGVSSTLHLKASSGADIKAKDFKAQEAVASVSSGADIKVYATESLKMTATSGGDIRYYGNPQNIIKTEAVSGDVKPGKE